MPISNQSETIDPRILRLIGLEDVFDLDYETYLTLLKEAMVKGRMTKKTIPTEEIMLVTDEYKRVKTKKDQGRFEVKKKKISPNSFNVNNVKGILPGTKKSQGLLPSQAIAKSPLTKSLEDNISAITAAVISINETLKNQQKIKSDASAYGKRQAEQEKRSLRESKLEKIFDGLKKTAEKIITPVKSLLDKIFDFIGTVILGRIVYKLVEWMGDPKNASKVKSIIRFVKDWWPALLASYVLFGNSFSGLIRGTIGMVGKFIFQIGKVAIPKLLSLIARNPLATLIVGSSVAGTFARTDERERLKPELDKQRASVEKTEKDSSAPWYQKLGGFFAKQELTTGQQRQSIVAPVPAAMFSGGGPASGFVSGEKGVDKIPAMLSDGEFVMSVGAVEKYGVDTLEAMNAAGGGTNKPKIVGGKTYADGGGLVGDANYYLKEILKGLSSQYKWAENLAKRAGVDAQNAIGQGLNFVGSEYEKGKKYVGDTYNQVINDPRVKEGIDAARQVYNKGRTIVDDVKKKGIEKGYLNEKGQLSGAAKNQATNFLSDLFPNLPGINQLNKKITENYLKSIGLTRENAKYGDMSSQALLTGKSGIDSAYNVGQMQLNKMSNESKQLYMKILKERMASGTLKSGDVINPYGMVDKSDPRYREQGNVRFYVDPKTGKGYLLDTYGFDPGKVNLGKGAAQKQYENQVKTFQDPKKKIKLGPLDIPIGQIAKKLDLRPMQDATEGGGLPQYILALRNKIFGYDAQKEGSKLDPRRFKTKAQIDELKELGDLKKFATNLSPTQKRLVDERLKKEKDNQKKKEQSSITMYKPNDPRRKQTGPYKSRFARPKNAGVKPVKPPTSSKPRVVYGPPVPSSRSSKSNKPAASRVPRFTAGTRGMRSKQETLGLMR